MWTPVKIQAMLLRMPKLGSPPKHVGSTGQPAFYGASTNTLARQDQSSFGKK
jgi:hypothetical protein